MTARCDDVAFCESHAGKCGGRQRFRTGQADHSNTARQRALGLTAFVDRLRVPASPRQMEVTKGMRMI